MPPRAETLTLGLGTSPTQTCHPVIPSVTAGDLFISKSRAGTQQSPPHFRPLRRERQPVPPGVELSLSTAPLAVVD